MNQNNKSLAERIVAHNNEFKVGDWISFFFLGPGEEQEGELVEIVDCVEGRVKTKYGTFRCRLSMSKIIRREPSPDESVYDTFGDLRPGESLYRELD